MKRTFIFISTLFISLMLFATNGFSQENTFRLNAYFGGNLNIDEGHSLIGGPMIDFAYFPFSMEKQGIGLPVGFGLTLGLLLPLKDPDIENESELSNMKFIDYYVMPIQADLIVEYDFTERGAKDLFFVFGLKIGAALGFKSDGVRAGFALSLSGGLQYYFVSLFGINISLGYSLLYIDNIAGSHFMFNAGFVFRF